MRENFFIQQALGDKRLGNEGNARRAEIREQVNLISGHSSSFRAGFDNRTIAEAGEPTSSPVEARA